MKKTLLQIAEVSVITKKDQKLIKGGFHNNFGCEYAQLVDCTSDLDCPCGWTCGVYFGGEVMNICATPFF